MKLLGKDSGVILNNTYMRQFAYVFCGRGVGLSLVCKTLNLRM